MGYQSQQICNCLGMDWKNKPNQIFNKVKLQMFSKGIQNFYYVDQFIRDFDPQNTGKLTVHQFNLFTNKIGVFLTTQQIRNIKDVYGKGDLIAYREFLEDVKYSIPQKITALIAAAYDKLDPNNSNSVNLQKVIDNYCVQNHPHVLSRRKKPQDIKTQFINGITRKAIDNNVSRQQFVDYYAELNFCVPNQHEQYLSNLLKGTWNIVDASEYVSPERLRQIELTLYQKVRQKSDGKTNEWKCAKKAMSYFDLGDQKSCSIQQFSRALDKFGCTFKKHEIQALFTKYDTDKSGRLDYEQFSKMLMDIDINGMQSKPNLLKTLGTNYFKITH